MEHKLLIGVTGPDGTGKTTLAAMIARHYGGTYHSVHKFLSALYQKSQGSLPTDRAVFTDFSNSLRFEAKDPAIAIRKIVNDILSKGAPGVHVIESFALAYEIAYADAACQCHAGRAQFMLFGIDAPLEQRYKWTNESSRFKPLPIPNAEVMYAIECRKWFEAKTWEPNIDDCIEMVPKENLFYNDNEGRGFVKELFLLKAKPIIDAVLATPQ